MTTPEWELVVTKIRESAAAASAREARLNTAARALADVLLDADSEENFDRYRKALAAYRSEVAR